MNASFVYKDEHVYAGGGKVADKPRELGRVYVNESGQLCVEPDDDYYHGRLTRQESIELARAILAFENEQKSPIT